MSVSGCLQACVSVSVHSMFIFAPVLFLWKDISSTLHRYSLSASIASLITLSPACTEALFPHYMFCVFICVCLCMFIVCVGLLVSLFRLCHYGFFCYLSALSFYQWSYELFTLSSVPRFVFVFSPSLTNTYLLTHTQ